MFTFTPAFTFADEAREDARRLFLAGRQAYEEGRLTVAASSFERAYELEPLPALLWNLGQTYRRQYVIDQDPDKLRRAVDHYRRYLKEAPGGTNRDEATVLLSELTPILARVAPEALGAAPQAPPPPPARTEVMVVTEAAHAQVSLDGAPPAPAPLLAEVKRGDHHARVEAPGYFADELTVTAVEGRLVVGEARLRAEPAHLRLVGDRGASLSIDGKPVGRLPLATLDLPAGRHQLAVTDGGHEPWAQELTLERGQHTALTAALRVTPQRQAARWLLLASGVAAAATVAAGAVWGQAEAAAGDLYDQQQHGQITTSQLADYNSDRSRRDDWRTGTYVALSLTAALAAITTALYLYEPATRR
jgi:hypothetical protein